MFRRHEGRAREGKERARGYQLASRQHPSRHKRLIKPDLHYYRGAKDSEHKVLAFIKLNRRIHTRYRPGKNNWRNWRQPLLDLLYIKNSRNQNCIKIGTKILINYDSQNLLYVKDFVKVCIKDSNGYVCHYR